MLKQEAKTQNLPIVPPDMKNPINVIARDKSGKSKTFTVDGSSVAEVSQALRNGLLLLAERAENQQQSPA